MRTIAFIAATLITAVGHAHGQLAVLEQKLQDVEAWAREDTNDAQRQYYLALRHWKEHHWRQTDSLLRLAVQLEPRYADAYLALYFLPYARRTTLAAEEDRNRVPKAWQPVVEEARRFYKLLDRTIKKTQRDEVVHVPLEDNEYRFILAALHHLTGNADSAVALYQGALERDLGLVMAHTYLANLHEGAGRSADALLERQRAAEMGDDPTALFDLAASLFNAGQSVDADEPLRRAIKLNARYAPSYYLLGRVTEELGLGEEARDHYTRFLALAPLRSAPLRADATLRIDKLK